MRPRFVSICTYHDHLVAVDQEGGIWIGRPATDRSLYDGFTWSLVQK